MERADDAAGPSATTRWPSLRRLLRHPGLARVGLLALLLLGVISAAWTLGRRGERDTATLDASTYAVFPFRSEGSTAGLWLDGDGAARLLHDAVGRWRGIHLVDDMRTNDVWTRARPHTVAEALDAAASLHAGVLAWGEVLPVGDSIEVRAVAYDVSRGPGTTRQFAVRLGREAAQVEQAFAMLADSIVIGGASVDDGAARGTKNLVALREFLDGRAALNQFDLGLAEQQFRKAIDADESYAHAHLWLARTLAWQGDHEPSEWAPDAARAVALSQSLADREKQHAEALLDLSAARMSSACRRYRALIAADSLDFAAWFGLGDCNARDPVVIRDAHSPTSYAFRGSYHTAIAAYRRALTLVPSFHLAERGLAFARLSRRVLFTEEARLRRGIGLGADTAGYGAFPSFVGDTLAFFPMPYLASTSTTTRPATERQAVRWSSGVSRQLMAEWVAAFPQSDDAQESYAQALESYAAVTGGGVADALVVARRALNASGATDARVRRSAMVVRLLLKADSIGAARALTDSVLRSATAPTPSQAGYLAGFAALTGRAARAATLLGIAARDSENVIFATAQGRRPALPFEVAETAHHLLAYASLGGPADSLRDSFLRTTRSIDQLIARPDRTVVRETVLRIPFALAYEQLAPLARFDLSPGRSELLAMRQALARSDTVDARRQSVAFTALADRYSPGTMGIDRLYQHANILLAMRDTASAVDRLDRALVGLRYSRQNLLTIIPQAAAIARTMALRAQLAQRAGDGKTVDHWAPAAEALWADADAGIRSQVVRDSRTPRSP
jgi:tetratricopeptide (TPR) repeat protein